MIFTLNHWLSTRIQLVVRVIFHCLCVGHLVSLSLFILPYLYLLSRLIKAYAVFSIGARMAVIVMLYIWMIFFLFKRFRNRHLAVWGTAVLLLIPLQFIINAVLSKIISEPLVDIWDVLTAFIILIVAFVIFICDYAQKKGIIRLSR